MTLVHPPEAPNFDAWWEMFVSRQCASPREAAYAA